MKHVMSPSVKLVLEGSRYWEDLEEAVYAIESLRHPDTQIDDEIDVLWQKAEMELGEDKDTVADCISKIWKLLEFPS